MAATETVALPHTEQNNPLEQRERLEHKARGEYD